MTHTNLLHLKEVQPNIPVQLGFFSYTGKGASFDWWLSPIHYTDVVNKV